MIWRWEVWSWQTSKLLVREFGSRSRIRQLFREEELCICCSSIFLAEKTQFRMRKQKRVDENVQDFRRSREGWDTVVQKSDNKKDLECWDAFSDLQCTVYVVWCVHCVFWKIFNVTTVFTVFSLWTRHWKNVKLHSLQCVQWGLPSSAAAEQPGLAKKIFLPRRWSAASFQGHSTTPPSSSYVGTFIRILTNNLFGERTENLPSQSLLVLC